MTAALAFLGVVVLHAAWLGVAAAAVAAIALRRLGASRSRERYAVALAALLAVVPGALLCALYPRLAADPAAVSPGLVDPGAVAAASAYSLAPATPWIGLLWAGGVAWGLLGLAVASAHLGRLRQRARPLPAAHAERLLARAREQLAYAGPVDLAISPDVGVPTVLGWRRPLCALPAAALTAWPGDDLEWLLVHELAHVRRADIAWGWAQSLVDVALFFHPAARWLSRQIRHERECCCDAAVLARPDALVPYVHALTRLAADRSAIRPALSATGGTLVSRVERLVDPTAPIPSCSRGLCLALVLGALAGAGTLAACETEEEDAAPAPAPSAVEQAVVPPAASVAPVSESAGDKAPPAEKPPPNGAEDDYPIPFIAPPEPSPRDTDC
ncbi:Signal transducer regulating beta-lactamase production, contains metallopeptidase domain [Nannocystis exedens]|uniref:Signal transducer regulating beta-lactamase production, contains metallopeptidase domain n=1 Tax=Nannocystis exedens TaxID=54 RepID=A0A1I2HUB5_9BACT|nr:M56 family metallopeptidase [Nannocystis exedens]PCC69422.1 Regulatory protein BlaR1 [Nannocystis exedens]SFF32021.1 Signal transducer regulating beta-lactamase production, contains metallopeptidase domain [Nannocystis exedens]